MDKRLIDLIKKFDKKNNLTEMILLGKNYRIKRIVFKEKFHKKQRSK
jgi:hypothetical protein